MKTPHLLGTIALLLCGFGVLISVEVIRPFRDMAIDGPIALGSWGAGLALGITCFFLKGRSLTLSMISVAANLLLLLAALALWVISNSNFAWH
ncbi:MAG: hypothetical protein ABI839_06735 [Verrucomicrobiota bacterium]